MATGARGRASRAGGAAGGTRSRLPARGKPRPRGIARAQEDAWSEERLAATEGRLRELEALLDNGQADCAAKERLRDLEALLDSTRREANVLRKESVAATEDARSAKRELEGSSRELEESCLADGAPRERPLELEALLDGARREADSLREQNH